MDRKTYYEVTSGLKSYETLVKLTFSTRRINGKDYIMQFFVVIFSDFASKHTSLDFAVIFFFHRIHLKPWLILSDHCIHLCKKSNDMFSYAKECSKLMFPGVSVTCFKDVM